MQNLTCFDFHVKIFISAWSSLQETTLQAEVSISIFPWVGMFVNAWRVVFKICRFVEYSALVFGSKFQVKWNRKTDARSSKVAVHQHVINCKFHEIWQMEPKLFSRDAVPVGLFSRESTMFPLYQRWLTPAETHPAQRRRKRWTTLSRSKHMTPKSSVNQRLAWRRPSKSCTASLSWKSSDLASIVKRGAKTDRNVGE